jgi:hypothetical protein
MDHSPLDICKQRMCGCNKHCRKNEPAPATHSFGGRSASSFAWLAKSLWVDRCHGKTSFENRNSRPVFMSDGYVLDEIFVLPE